MDSRYGTLKSIRTNLALPESPIDQGSSFGNHGPVPQGPVLVSKQDDISLQRLPSLSSRFVEQHQAQQTQDLAIWQQVGQQSPQPNSLCRQIGSDNAIAGVSRIAFVENQVDNAKHAFDARRQFPMLRHRIRQAGFLDPELGPDDALRQGWRTDEKRSSDFFGCQTAYRAQRQRNLRLGRYIGMTACEDQPQLVVRKVPSLPPAPLFPASVPVRLGRHQTGHVCATCRGRESAPLISTMR